MSHRNLPLPEDELRAILRAADDIIGQGGRSLLSKILKGSKDKKLLELGLDQNPSYGFYRDLTLQQITDKVDHMIHTDFLELQKSGKLPMIAFTPRGWAVERERRAEQFLQEWDRWIESNVVPISMEYLKDRNRGMIFLFLYKVLCTGHPKYIPYLTMWERIDYQKVRVEIRKVIAVLKRWAGMGDSARERLKQDMAQSLIIRSQGPIILACYQCGRPFVFDEMNLDYYTEDGLRFPEQCINCLEGRSRKR